MDRVLLVTRYPTRAIELRRQEFEVLDFRSREDVEPGTGRDVSAALVDLLELADVRGVIATVRGDAPQVPIVVLGPQQEPWQALEEDGFTLLVAPPVSFEQVAGALRSLIQPEPVPHPTSDEWSPLEEERAADDVGPGAGPRLASVDPSEAVTSEASPEVEPADGSEPTDEADQPEEHSRADPVDDAQGNRPRRPWLFARRRPLSQSPRPMGWRETAVQLVRQLGAAPTVTGACNTFCAELATRCAADAVAVLVRDGDRWQIEGSIGLRPLEHRLGLDSDDWLVRKLRLGPPVVVIPDTDMVRGELAFTPLASRPRLLAACFGDLESIILVGRTTEPFTRDDVAILTARIADFAEELGDALEARAVAQEMARFL